MVKYIVNYINQQKTEQQKITKYCTRSSTTNAVVDEDDDGDFLIGFGKFKSLWVSDLCEKNTLYLKYLCDYRATVVYGEKRVKTVIRNDSECHLEELQLNREIYKGDKNMKISKDEWWESLEKLVGLGEKIRFVLLQKSEFDKTQKILGLEPISYWTLFYLRGFHEEVVEKTRGYLEEKSICKHCLHAIPPSTHWKSKNLHKKCFVKLLGEDE